jgi:antitoxin component of MazEF toxin-antitoxin module
VETVIKRLVRHGNSRALVIDKPILELLKVDENGAVEITTDGTSLIMRPVSAEEARRIEFEAALEQTNEGWGGALKKLAE